MPPERPERGVHRICFLFWHPRQSAHLKRATQQRSLTPNCVQLCLTEVTSKRYEKEKIPYSRNHRTQQVLEEPAECSCANRNFVSHALAFRPPNASMSAMLIASITELAAENYRRPFFKWINREEFDHEVDSLSVSAVEGTLHEPYA